MGKNGTWGGHPDVYATAWFYDVYITIYSPSPEYTNTGGFLVFKPGGPNGTCNTPTEMWNISYHSTTHFNRIRSPKNPPCPSHDKCYQTYIQNDLDDYQDNFAKLAFLSYNNGTPIRPYNIKPMWATTGLIMLYIAVHLLTAVRAPISESGMKILLNQAEKCAMEYVQAKYMQPSLQSAQAPDLVSPTQAAIACYRAELHATIIKHHDSVLQLLKLSATIEPLLDLSTHYDKLRSTSFPIRSGLATLITHMGREEISVQELKILTHQTKKSMLLNYMPHPCHLKCPPLLLSSPPEMFLLPKSHSIPFVPLVK
jgi:hypothetical protein